MANILIIDDSLLQRMIIRNIIEEGGYKVLEASSGNEGLKMIESHKPDCIILDLLMPDINGIKILETLGDRTTEIPVVIVTSDIQESTRQQCIELGASGFLNKPPKKDMLLNILNKHLKNKKDNNE